MRPIDPRDPGPTGRAEPSESRGPRLPANVAGGLAYAVGPLTGALLLVDRRPFVRFHAAQSLGGSAAVGLLGVLLGRLRDLLGGFTSPLGELAALAAGGLFLLAVAVAWLRVMQRAFRGEAWALPGLGPFLARVSRSKRGRVDRDGA